MSQKLLSSTHGRLPRQPSVHRIPAEILVEIFLLVRNNPTAPPASATCNQGQVYAGNFALLCVSAVCMRWRLVATNFSSLWNKVAFSTLNISSIQCAELFLGRTKRCVLHVYISAPALQDSSAISALLHELLIKISSESHRIQLLDLFITPRAKVLYTYWTDPTMNPYSIQGVGDDDTIPSRSRFLQAESMRLSSPVWYPGVAPRLKCLELRNDNNAATLSSLLRALEDCPALEFLTLQGYRQFVDEISPDVPVAALPRLHRLHLFSCDAVPIMASVHLPSITHPLVIFDSNPHGTIIPYLQRQHGALYLKGVSKLRVELNNSNSNYSVAAYRDDGRMNLYLGVSTVSHLPTERWVDESMGTITSFDLFSQATSLSITADIIFSSWSPWLSKMCHTSKLDLCCPDARGCLNSLSTLVDGSPPCPSLNTLAFRGFRRWSKFDYKLLKACILFRLAAGRPLTSVLVPGYEWPKVRAWDPSWDALVDSQATAGDRFLLQLSVVRGVGSSGSGLIGSSLLQT